MSNFGMETHNQTDTRSLPTDVPTIVDGLKRRCFSLQSLMAAKFSPYYPQCLGIGDLNAFCSKGIDDMRVLIAENEHDLREAGLLSASIIGAASSRLAGVFPYGVLKDRQDSSYYLKRTSDRISDIDTNFHVDDGRIDVCVSFMRELAVRYRERGRFKTEPRTLSFYFIPYQKLIDIIQTKVRVYAFVSALLWQNSRIPLMDDNVYCSIQQAALRRYYEDNQVRDFFWQNLIDRYIFSQCKIAVKLGVVDEVILTPDVTPTIFDPEAKSVKAKCEGGYFKI